MVLAARLLGLALMAALAAAPALAAPIGPLMRASFDHVPVARQVNVIDGEDDRDSLLVLAPRLGLSEAEVARIRRVSGYVGCLSPSPSMGTGTLFLTNDQILTVSHIFFEPSGTKRSNCFFKNQDEVSIKIDLLTDTARFGARRPKAGSNDDYAIVKLVTPLEDAEPFPVDTETPIAAGDDLIVITAHPAGMERDVDTRIPVAQRCTVRRVPQSTAATSFYRTDCDASGSSSGGVHLARVGGRLVFRGISITTGQWRDPAFHGMPYNERMGSVTTALGTDAGILAAGRAHAREAGSR